MLNNVTKFINANLPRYINYSNITPVPVRHNFNIGTLTSWLLVLSNIIDEKLQRVDYYLID